MTSLANGERRLRTVDVSAPELVTQEGRLIELVLQWCREPVIALDTEFVRTRTFYARLGLVQVGWPGGCALIDCVALKDLSAMRPVLLAPTPVKVLHSPAEDLEVFLQVFGELAFPLFDTQIAATLVGRGSFPGYQRLVRDLFGVELAKEQQRSNWMKRPLGADQVTYAATDVKYLLPAYEELNKSLEEMGRSAWATEEFERLSVVAREKNDPQVVFERLRRPSMKPQEAGVLAALVGWRESEARRRDLPRGFVLKDDVLLQLARRRPKTAEELSAVEALGEGIRRRVGRELLRLIREAPRFAPAETARINVDKTRLRQIRELAAKLAAELGVPDDFLLTKRDAQRLAQVGGLEAPLEQLSGWRGEVLGGPLAELRLTWLSESSH